MPQKNSIWTLTEKGGVGKTLVASLLVSHLQNTGRKPIVVDADVQSADDQTSSLSTLINGVVESIEIGISPAALLDDPTLALSHWDRLIDMIDTETSVVDFGANVAAPLMHWCAESEIDEVLTDMGITVTVVIPTTANPTANEDALKTTDLVKVALPSADVVVVLNKSEGDFTGYEGTASFDKLAKMARRNQIAVASIGRCISEIFKDVERQRIPVFEAICASPVELAEQLGTSPLPTRRGKKHLAIWYANAIDGLVAAGALPPEKTEINDTAAAAD